jgi:hypothetical protein
MHLDNRCRSRILKLKLAALIYMTLPREEAQTCQDEAFQSRTMRRA